MKSVVKQVSTIEETLFCAMQLMNLLCTEKQVVILLDGDLGAGKTTFTKGIAQALEITEKIKSPTYTIVKEYYSGSKDLYHFDAYRLEDTPEFDLGFDEYFEKEGIIVIEWSQFIQNELPDKFINVKIKRETGIVDLEDSRRLIEISSNHYEDVLENL